MEVFVYSQDVPELCNASLHPSEIVSFLTRVVHFVTIVFMRCKDHASGPLAFLVNMNCLATQM